MVKGYIANFGISPDVSTFSILSYSFRLKEMGFWVFLVHPIVVSVLLSASVERCFVSRMRDFLTVLIIECACDPLFDFTFLIVILILLGSHI